MAEHESGSVWRAYSELRERVAKLEADMSPIKLAVFGLIALIMTSFVIGILRVLQPV